jgi:hypothetical protein
MFVRPPRAAYLGLRSVAARGSDGRRSESSLHRVPLFKQTYIRSEADIRSTSPVVLISSRTVARKVTEYPSLQGGNETSRGTEQRIAARLSVPKETPNPKETPKQKIICG